MQNTIKTLIISTLTLAALTLGAAAEPSTDSFVDKSVTEISKTLQATSKPQQPLVTQDSADGKQPVTELKDRPRGESRTRARDAQRPSREEKPAVQVKGF